MRCWIHPEQYRYYQAELVPGLFGDWSLVCAWGGLGTPRGGYKITGVADYEDGLRKIEVLDVHRQRRGYVPVASLAHWGARIGALRQAGLVRPQTGAASSPSDPAQADLLKDALDGLDLWDMQVPGGLQGEAK